jgi:undecaprenyl-diphosphatase
MKTPDSTNGTLAARVIGLSRRVGLTLLIGLGVAAGALFFFARLASEMLEGDAKQFDEWARSGIHQFASPALTVAMRVVTMLGAPFVLISLSLVAGLAFVARRNYRAMTLLVATMAGSTLLNEVLKLSFHRTRPEPFFEIQTPGSFSFPSGHALASFCFYSTIAALISARTKSRTVRIVVWTLAALLITLIGLSRIYLGVHYPTDVLAGYAAAFIWVIIIAVADRTFPGRDHTSGSSSATTIPGQPPRPPR